MNAAIQLLRSVPELNEAIKKYNSGGMNENADKQITNSLSSVFNRLEKEDYSPNMFVAFFLQNHETYLPLGTQHDSDEFMQELIGIFNRSSPELDKLIKSLF